MTWPEMMLPNLCPHVHRTTVSNVVQIIVWPWEGKLCGCGSEPVLSSNSSVGYWFVMYCNSWIVPA